jgi:PAS domain S-box-containing protein
MHWLRIVASSTRAWTRYICRPHRLVVAVSLGLIAVIQVSAGLMIYDSRGLAFADKSRELSNLSLVISDQVNRVFDAVMSAQLNLSAQLQARSFDSSDDFESELSGRATHLDLQMRASNLPQIGKISLIKADGRVISDSNSWPPRGENVSDSDYVAALRGHLGSESVLGHPTHDGSGRGWMMHIAHSVVDRNGKLIGIVATSIDLSFFSKMFERLLMRSDTSISQFMMDGTLLARHPHIESAIGRGAGSKLPFMQLLAKANHGSGRFMSVFDGKERMIAAHRVTNYPLVLVTTETTDSVLADWRRMTMHLVIAAGVITGMVLAGMFLALTRSRRYVLDMLDRARQRENERIAKKLRQMDAALDTISQGISVFDADQRLVMCNGRYVEIYKFTPDQVNLGTTLRQIVEYRIESDTYSGHNPDEYRTNALAAAVERIAASRNIHTSTAGGDASYPSWGRFECEINDGRTIAIVTRPMPSGGWIATHEDITPNLRLKKEHIPMTVFVKTATDFRYLLMNRAGEQTHGLSRDKVIGKTAHEAFSQEAADRIVEQDRRFLLSGDRVSTVEQRIVSGHGEEKLFQLTRVKIWGDSGKVEYILGIAEDCTGLRESPIKPAVTAVRRNVSARTA